MRKILFRGKRVEDGKWTYGLPYYDMLGKIGIKTYSDDFYFSSSHLVIPETVGQYLGTEDKKDKQLFEGDIVKVSEYKNIALMGDTYLTFEEIKLFTLDECKGELKDEYESVVEYEDGEFLIHCSENCDMGIFLLFGDQRGGSTIYEFEIIGNIHDKNNDK